EGRLDAADERPGDLRHAVAPFVRVPHVAGPLLGDRRPAGEGDAPVDDDGPPMVAPIDPNQMAKGQRPETLYPHAGLGELAPVLFLELERPEPIHQQPDLDAGPGALHERVHELPADLVRLEDVDAEIDRLAGPADRLEHRRIETVAV